MFLRKTISQTDGKTLSFLKVAPYNYLLSHKEKFDVIDISSDFLGSGDNNKYSYTVDAVKLYLSSLSAGGVLSIPVNITEFTVHSSKLIETVRRALAETGASYPSMNIMIYRSNWDGENRGIQQAVLRGGYRSSQEILQRTFL